MPDSIAICICMCLHGKETTMGSLFVQNKPGHQSRVKSCCCENVIKCRDNHCLRSSNDSNSGSRLVWRIYTTLARQAGTTAAADSVRAQPELGGLMQQGLIRSSASSAETSKDSLTKFKCPRQCTGHTKPHLLCISLLIDGIIRDS